MSTSTLPCKPTFELDSPGKIRYWYRLESESSAASTDGTESVYSIQDRETDFVRDTTDTDSDSSQYDIDIDIEYEINSLSGDDDDKDMIIFGSSDESEDMLYAAAAVLGGDSSLEAFITDGEDSDNSREGDSSSHLKDFQICVQCKSRNDNPQYRYCDKCYQERKAIFGSPPRRRKKAEKKKSSHSPVKLQALQSCLSGLSSQDSGIGSSQEFGGLCLDQIVVPNAEKESKGRKRQISESSLSDGYEEQRPKKVKREKVEEKKEEEKGVVDKVDVERTEQVKELPELREDCIMCNTKPKNSVFLHGRIAHMCCCYTCAMKTWKSLKRCPICQRKVNNVVRVFTN